MHYFTSLTAFRCKSWKNIISRT